MTITVREAWKSREGVTSRDPKRSTGQLSYYISGTTDKAAARTALLGVAPAGYDGKLIRNVNLTYHAPNTYLGVVNYDDDLEALDVGEWRLSFSTKGGMVRQTVAFDERRYPSTAPDQERAINVIDGRAQGIDVPIGTIQLTCHFRAPRAQITVPYLQAIADLVGKTNNAEYLGFDAGELLFLGLSGSLGSATDPVLDYEFLAGKNVTDLYIESIGPIEKKAHEYLWVLFRDTVDEDTLVNRTEAVYVNQVHRTANFETLDIDGAGPTPSPSPSPSP